MALERLPLSSGRCRRAQRDGIFFIYAMFKKKLFLNLESIQFFRPNKKKLTTQYPIYSLFTEFAI